MTSTVAPLLGGLFLILATGALLRLRGGVAAGDPQKDADVLNRLIMDVTMPALIVQTLTARGFVWSTGTSLLATTAALVVGGAVAALAVRVLGADRRVQGSALLVGAFCNTGFLGFPLLLKLFPGDELASSTALLVDTVNTTLMLWVVGLPVAALVAGKGKGTGTPMVSTVLRLLLRPLALSVVVGLAMNALDVTLPSFVDGALGTLGAATSPLVFLSLGLQLDVSALRGRALPMVATALVKLAVVPVVCLLVARLIGVVEPVASVAVLQTAMPSAMVSVIVAAEAGGDRPFAAGVATLTTLSCLVSLPAVGWLLDAVR